MPETPAAPPSRPRRRQALLLAGLTLAVLLGHWAILLGAPLATLRTETSSAVSRPFTMRTISTPTTAGAPAPSQRKAPPRVPPQTKPESTAPDAPASPVITEGGSPAASPHVAVEPIANSTPKEDDPVQLAAANTATATEDMVVTRYVIPGSIRLKYDVKGEIKGFPYFANGELLWLQDGKTYDARLEISHFLLGSRVQTSKGQLTSQGLEPIRFGDKVRSEVAAHFERNKGKVTFSANTPDAPLQVGAQDQLSVFLQLASIMGGEKERILAGDLIPFQAIGARTSESWVFNVGGLEALTLPGGSVNAIKLTRESTAEYDTKVDIWLAPEMEYLPVRIRLSQRNGDFVEQQWRATQKP